MRLFAVGCSYRTAPLGLRERLVVPAGGLEPALRELQALPGLAEALLLSTCNRIEVYGAAAKPAHAARRVIELLSRANGVALEELHPAVYLHEDSAALQHIFAVTSSLDSMVVGEAQIAGQVKEAYAAASRARTIGPLLSRCLHRAFATAKRVRTETEIARHPVSVSSVAADLAARVFDDLGECTVLVLGAGEMAELAARHLISDGARDLRVVNRTPGRAEQLAAQLGAKAARFEQLRAQLVLADVLISSTGSTEPIISRKLLAETLRERRQRPLLIVDIAVPRDVERAAGDLPNVFLYDLDDLEQVVAENMKERRKAVRQAERLVQQEVVCFEEWQRSQDAVPLIKQLRDRFGEVLQAEAAHTAEALRLDEQQRQLMETMTAAMVNKLLHRPSLELKRHAGRSSTLSLAQATRELFDLSLGESPSTVEVLELEVADAPPAAQESEPSEPSALLMKEHK